MQKQIKKKLIISLFFLNLITIPLHNVFSHHLITSFEKDLTGDGLNESIQLNGERLSEESNYYRNIWLSITSPFNNEWKIPLKSGYMPRIQFIDLNHDHVNDIFFAIKRLEDENVFQYHLYTLADGKIKKLPLPKNHIAQAQYEDNYKISLKLSPYEDEIIINLNKKAKDKVEHGIYKDGKLIVNKKPYLSSIIHFKPVLINKSKGYGLESINYLKTDEKMDPIGKIKTLWYFSNNDWIILQSEWIEQS